MPSDANDHGARHALTAKDVVYISERQLAETDFTPVYHRQEQCSGQIPDAHRTGLAKLWADRVGRPCALCVPAGASEK